MSEEKFISTKELITLATDVVNYCIEEQGYFNPIKLEIVSAVLYAKNYISGYEDISDEEFYDSYDILRKDEITKKLPLIKQYKTLLSYVTKSTEAIERYNNSALGILERMANKNNDVLKNFDEVAAQIKGDKDLKEFVKDVVPKLV